MRGIRKKRKARGRHWAWEWHKKQAQWFIKTRDHLTSLIVEVSANFPHNHRVVKDLNKCLAYLSEARGELDQAAVNYHGDKAWGIYYGHPPGKEPTNDQ